MKKNKYQFNYYLILTLFLFFACAEKKKKLTADDAYNSFLQEIKDSLQPLNSEIEKINYIRNKIAYTVDLGMGGKDIEQKYKNWTELSSSQFYNAFQKKEGTVKCGGVSHFLKNVYQDLGYHAMTYDMGYPEHYTHQVVLVKNKQDGKHYVEDAYYNVSYHNQKKAETINFENLISLLSQRRANEIFISKDSSFFKMDTTGLFDIIKKRGLQDHYNTATNNLHTNTRASFYNNITNNPFTLKSLYENNLPENPLYFFLLPLEHNSEEVMNIYNKAIDKKEN